MKRVFLAMSLFSAAAFAETWTGTVVDVSCHTKDLASHTKKCAMNCAKSGYGLVTADGKFIKLLPLSCNAEFQRVKSSCEEGIIINLKGIPPKIVGRARAHTSFKR